MNDKDDHKNDEVDIPQEAAEAWADVYIDVAEKLDAEAKPQAETKTDPEDEDNDDQPS